MNRWILTHRKLENFKEFIRIKRFYIMIPTRLGFTWTFLMSKNPLVGFRPLFFFFILKNQRRLILGITLRIHLHRLHQRSICQFAQIVSLLLHSYTDILFVFFLFLLLLEFSTDLKVVISAHLYMIFNIE